MGNKRASDNGELGLLKICDAQNRTKILSKEFLTSPFLMIMVVMMVVWGRK